MGTMLLIPWFKLDPIDAPLPWLAGVLLVGCALAALNPRWRQQAQSMAGFTAVASLLFIRMSTGGFDALGDLDALKEIVVPIQPFGILVATGVILGTRLAEAYAKSLGIDPYHLADFATHAVFTGFVFAMLLNAIFYETEDFLRFLSSPSGNLKWFGLSSYGGFIGAMVGIYIWRKRRGLPAWPLSDAVAFGFPLGWMFGRTGCFVVHDHPGKVTDFFLAVDNYYEAGQPRHDLGFYEILYAAVIMGIFLLIRKKWPVTRDENGTAKGGRPMGLFVGLMPLLYTPGRFFLDTLRATDLSSADKRYLGLTPAQYASIGMLIMAVVLLRRAFTKPEWVIPDALRPKTVKPDAGSEPEAKKETDAKPQKQASETTGASKSSSSTKRRKKKKKR
ncbi:MAG: prolipoprotein diacylglyceryl transferase family protein [Myxococcota bacterium]